MNKRIIVTKSIHDRTKPFRREHKMCKTCAYHSPLSEDEKEFELSAAMERGRGKRPMPHACHERSNVWCVGSVATIKRLFGVSI